MAQIKVTFVMSNCIEVVTEVAIKYLLHSLNFIY